jgi:hypothetical protein
MRSCPDPLRVTEPLNIRRAGPLSEGVTSIVPLLVIKPEKVAAAPGGTLTFAPEGMVKPAGALIVPPDQVELLTVSGPLPVKVPSLCVQGPLSTDAAASDNDPADSDSVVVLPVCRLWTASALVEEWVTEMPAVVIVTSSPLPGTTPPLQLAPVSQSPPMGLVQLIEAGARRSSSLSR